MANTNSTLVQNSGPSTFDAHAVIEQCSRLTPDPFWHGLLGQVSQGIMPPRFALKENKLTYYHRQRYRELVINTDPTAALPAVIEFFQHHGSIYSYLDNEISDIPSPIVTWSDVTRRPRLLQNVIFTYTQLLCRELHLDEQDRQYLQAMLTYSIRSQEITTVVYNQGMIRNIPQLIYDQNHKAFFLVVNGCHNPAAGLWAGLLGVPGTSSPDPGAPSQWPSETALTKPSQSSCYPAVAVVVNLTPPKDRTYDRAGKRWANLMKSIKKRHG